MNSTSFTNPGPSPQCAEIRAGWQRKLDDVASTENDTLQSHRATCPSCREFEETARRFEAALKLQQPEILPIDFAERVLTRYRAEPARPWLARHAGIVGGFVLAASVLIAVLAVNIPRNEPLDSGSLAMRSTLPPVVLAPDRPSSLSDSLNEAGSAFASLTQKATEEAFDWQFPALSLPMNVPLDRLEPAVASIQTMGQGAALGMTPFANTARRAADLFLREIGVESERLPGVN